MFKRFRNTSPPAREADESYEFVDPPSPSPVPARAATASPSDSASPSSPMGMGIGGQVQPSSSGSGSGSNPQGIGMSVSGGGDMPEAEGREATATPDYPAWLPRRPPPPAPPSTVASVRGATPTFPFQRSTSGTGSGGGRHTHRVNQSADTGYRAGTEGTESIEIVDMDVDVEEGEIAEVGAGDEGVDEVTTAEGGVREIGIGRHQTPRSVRIVSLPLQPSSSSTPRKRRSKAKRESVRGQGRGNYGSYSRRQSGEGERRTSGEGEGAWWRPTGRPLSQQQHARPVSTSAVPTPAPRPRFRHPLFSPSILLPPAHSATSFFLYSLWILWLPLVVIAPVVIQTYLDINVGWVLVSLALHPTPASDDTLLQLNEKARREWSLAAAAYALCWFSWFFGVLLLRGGIWGFVRRWRVRRPLVLPLYLSSSAFDLVCLTSYAHFCFMMRLRWGVLPNFKVPRFLRSLTSLGKIRKSVWKRKPNGKGGSDNEKSDGSMSGESGRRSGVESQSGLESGAENNHNANNNRNNGQYASSSSSYPQSTGTSLTSSPSNGSWKPSYRTFFAETCYFYAQGTPAVALLLPRVFLAIVVILGYSSPRVEDVLLANSTVSGTGRDGVFFGRDGGLSGYGKGAIWAMLGIAALKIGVWSVSWFGLWLLSGQACAGICGPRHRWEEPEEKAAAVAAHRYEAAYNAQLNSGATGNNRQSYAVNPNRFSSYIGGYASGPPGGFPYPDGAGDEEEAYDPDEDGAGVSAAWSWRAQTRARVRDVFELCCVGGTGPRSLGFVPQSFVEKERRMNDSQEQGNGEGEVQLAPEELERVLAAAGLPTGGAKDPQQTARRGVLRGELFETPPRPSRDLPADDDDQLQVVGLPVPPRTPRSRGSGSKSHSRAGSKKGSKEKEGYAFTGFPAQASSADVPMGQGMIPFPPSPTKMEHETEGETHDQSDVEIDIEDEEDEEDDYGVGVEEPSASSELASGSMSSLGQAIPSHFPFQFRQVQRQGKRRKSRAMSGSVNSKGNASSMSASVSASASMSADRSGSSDPHASAPKTGAAQYQYQHQFHPHHRQQTPSGDISTGESLWRSPSSGLPSPSSERAVHESHSHAYHESFASSSGPGSPASPSSPSSIPPPRGGRGGQRQRRSRMERSSLPTVPVAALGDVGSEEYYYEGGDHPRAVGRARSRTYSGGGAGEQTFGPHPAYESSDEEIEVGVEDVEGEGDEEHDGEEELGMMTDPEPEGSQEAAEREDSVGLLSGGPSPRSSQGALRSRSSLNLNVSLTNVTLGLPPRAHLSSRSRHSSASSQSFGRSISGSQASLSGSASGSHVSHRSSVSGESARSRSLSARARSRTHSLIQSLRGGASTSSISIDIANRANRSRAHSMSPVAEGVSASPISPRMRTQSSTGASGRAGPRADRHRVGSSAAGSGGSTAWTTSGSGSGQGSPNNPEYTFGQKMKLRVQAPEDETGDTVEGSQELEPPELAENSSEIQEVPRTESEEHAGSRYIQVQPPSTSTQPVPMREASVPSSERPLQGVRSFVSSANESFITGPATLEGSSDTTGRTPDSYETARFGRVDHGPNPTGSGWGPA